MAKASKQDTAPAAAPPPPDLAAAYDTLLKAHADVSQDLEAAKVRIHDLESQGPADLEPLRRECDDLRDKLEKAKAHAEASRNAAARAQQELAAARAAVPHQAHVASTNTGHLARTFLYVKGDPKNPNSPRVRVRAFTQALAEEQPEAKAALADGYVFRGCI
jgi:hypothetical protein